MPTIADLTIDLHANVASLRNDLGKATQETQKFAKNVQGAFRGLRNIAGTLGVAIGVQQIISFGSGALKAAAGIGEMAKQLGLSASAFQELQYAAKQSGVEDGQLESAFGKLSRSIGDAANGSKSAVEAFNRMGVAFVDNEGKARGNEAVFRDIAEAYQNAADKGKFVSDMATILGRSANKLIPLFEEGADGLDRFAKRANELGIVLRDDFVKQADEAVDSLSTLYELLQKASAKWVIQVAVNFGLIDASEQQKLDELVEERAALLKQVETGRMTTGSKGTMGQTASSTAQQVAMARIEVLNEEIKFRRQLLEKITTIIPPSDGGGGGTGGGGGKSTATPDWLKDIREILNDDSWENKNTGIVKFSSLTQEAADETMYFGDAISGLTNDLVAAAQGTTDFKTIFLNNLNSILAGIADGLMGLAGGGSGSSSGGIGGIISGVIGLVGGAFGGGLSADPFPGTTGRASGGPVRGGMPYTVGEDGPELFVPSQSGDIFPNGSGSGGSTIVNNFNFQGSTLDQTRVRAQIARAMPQIVRSSEAHLSDSKKRGALPAFR
jgi:hypothetical protein